MKLTSVYMWLGIAMTAALALIGKGLALVPGLSMIGPMVLAILLGMSWATWGPQPTPSQPVAMAGGYTFASKYLLRAGIILLGVRLDLLALGHAGVRVLGTEIVLVTLTLLVGYWIARRFGVDQRLAMVIAAGTAICGAAAAVAIAVQVRARSEQTALGVATVAVLGTVFTVLYTLLAPWLELSDAAFGAFSGATLHEIAHVIAAATPHGADSLDNGLLVKLSRVVLLAPVALFVGWKFDRKQASPEGPKQRTAPIPYFVLGFLLVGALHTWHVLPDAWTQPLIQTSLFLLTMGMAGLGLQVNIRALRGGGRAFQAALITSLLLAFVGYGATKVLLFP
ncbi:YeiH family protein [Tumebacillus permanentifrigoris]|uniref:Putative integral membrane protein (TIGR00698 family) n=1 Tax=Tumebacillus permanentifrigoris TaxID=378543 RepID=A0A316DXM6_9BACL|nr:putative sulfate exporter family transporter [Tumebacillus permanentifrigoris]PWK14871.1 putative integral membrane protein (TIGR00698 family) [Tumebacillus permanentifrigoris]